jgi:predicted nucleotidyltransferase
MKTVKDSENFLKMNTAKLLRQYFQESGAGISAVYLFGSRARGGAGAASDADIAILFESNDPGTVQLKIQEILKQLPRVLKTDVHPVALNFAGETLLSQIFSKGKCILVNDPKRFAEFRMVAYARIAGFSYYRRKMQEGFVRRVMART